MPIAPMPSINLLRLYNGANVELPTDAQAGGASVINAAARNGDIFISAISTGVETSGDPTLSGIFTFLSDDGAGHEQTLLSVPAKVTALPAGNPTGDSVFTVAVRAGSANSAALAKLPDGLYTVNADVQDRAGDSAPEASRQILVDTTADAGPSTTLVVNTGSNDVINATAAHAVSFTVAGLDSDASAIATFTDGTHLVSATVASNGNGTIDLSSLNSVVSSSLAITDVHGNTANANGNTVTVDTQPPAAPASLADAAVVNGYVSAANDTATQTLTGTAEANCTVTVYDNGTALSHTATADASGYWSYTLGHLSDGTHSLTATATDAAGNTSAASAALAFTVDASGSGSSGGGSGVDAPNEALFGTVTTDPHSHGGEVYALYEGLLGRAPDTAGLQSWTSALDSGMSLRDVTTAMLASPEVQSHLSATDNAGYVAQVYETVLHRDADAAGLQSWTAALDSGATSRADLVDAAVLSPEHVASIQPALDAGVFVPDQNAVAVAQLYYATLGRAPDAAGLQAYTAALDSGATTLHDIAQAALGSSEFAGATTAATAASASAYVESVYEQVLGRHSDAAGLQSWTDALAHGTAQTSVAMAAVDSSEYQGQYAGQSNGAYVEGLYEHLFGRQGDAAGLQSWTSALDSHATTRVDLANAFVNSAEFQAHFGLQAGGASGGPSDAAFVEGLYENALGRHADAAGLQGWTDALAHGTSRADVAVAIAEGAEAQQHLAAQIQQSYHVA